VAGGVGTLDEQEQGVGQAAGAGRERGAHARESLPDLGLDRYREGALWAGGVGELDRAVPERAAAVAGGGDPLGQVIDHRQELVVRGVVLSDQVVPPLPVLLAAPLQVRKHQVVLGVEGAVQADLGHARRLRDRLHASRPDAFQVEQLPGRVQYLGPRAGGRRWNTGPFS
jgi:hypothetical protein